MKKIIFLFTLITLACIAPVEMFAQPVDTAVTVLVDTPTDVEVPFVTNPTQADVEGLYLKYFASPVAFLIMIVFLTGYISKWTKANGDWTQAISWILGAGLGAAGSAMGWGMFADIDILHSIILGVTTAVGTNLVKDSGKINGGLRAFGASRKA